jgi:uncharacterized protein YfkK (UPF0435 family)
MLYFTPIIGDAIKENPFKIEKRNYPIDYGFNTKITSIYQFTVPEGFEITETPKSITFSLPNRDAQYMYSVNIIGNKIQVMSLFSINKPVFQSSEYEALKNFYDIVIAKQKEQIVLKKK